MIDLFNGSLKPTWDCARYIELPSCSHSSFCRDIKGVPKQPDHRGTQLAVRKTLLMMNHRILFFSCHSVIPDTKAVCTTKSCVCTQASSRAACETGRFDLLHTRTCDRAKNLDRERQGMDVICFEYHASNEAILDRTY